MHLYVDCMRVISFCDNKKYNTIFADAAGWLHIKEISDTRGYCMVNMCFIIHYHGSAFYARRSITIFIIIWQKPYITVTVIFIFYQIRLYVVFYPIIQLRLKGKLLWELSSASCILELNEPKDESWAGWAFSWNPSLLQKWKSRVTFCAGITICKQLALDTPIHLYVYLLFTSLWSTGHYAVSF